MESIAVNRALAKTVRPLLRSAGFDTFTQRTAWRHSPDKIDVVNFQSFNAHQADLMGCTTYSFSVNLGSYFLFMPHIHSPKLKDGRLCPQEYECHFRGSLHRRFEQRELARKDTWFIDEAGKYLDQALTDVCSQIEAVALPWFARNDDANEVLEVLLNVCEDESFTLWGFGRNPSPIRSLMTGYAALKTGDSELARTSLRAAKESGCFNTAPIGDVLAKLDS
jgi:hypothetical protein